MPGPTDYFPKTANMRQWNEFTNIEPRDVFSHLAKSLVTLKRKDWETAARSCYLDVFSSDPTHLTYNLIWRGLSEALFELTWELLPWLKCIDPLEADDLAAGLDFSFLDQELTIDISLFRFPEDCRVLNWMKPIYRDWLVLLGLAESMAGPAVDRLLEYFADRFFTEWLAHPDKYASIGKFLDDRPDPLDSMGWAWAAYDRRMKKLARAPYFDQEPFDLSQFYVQPRAYELCSEVDHPDFMELDQYLCRSGRGMTRRVFDLEYGLLQWLQHSGDHDPVRLIASISAFQELVLARRLTIRINQSPDHHCLYLPLGWSILTEIKKLGLERVMARYCGFPESPFKHAARNPVMLFTMPIQIALDNDQAAGMMSDFLNSLKDFLRELNLEKKRLRVILAGPQEVVGHVQRHLGSLARIYHTLPYVIHQKDGPPFTGPRELIDLDQRNLWWQRYGALIGRYYRGLPDDLTDENPLFQKMTGNSTFGYLLANIREKQPESINKIKDLTDLVRYNFMIAYRERIYNDEKKYNWLYWVSWENFTNILGEIAINAWHHPNGHAPVAPLKKIYDRSGLGDNFSAVIELTEAEVIRYFLTLHNGETESPTLSFPYRELRNLLVAHRLLLEVIVIRDGFARSKTHPARGMDEKSALGRIFRLFGPARVTERLFGFLSVLIQRQDDSELDSWQECLIRLLNLVVNEGWPARALVEKSFSEHITTQMRNSEETLLVLAGLCALAKGQRYSLNWPSSVSAANWLGRLLLRKGLFHSPITLQCLEYLDLSGCQLDGLNFYGGNLKHTSLKNASLNYACLVAADMQESELNDASLHHANMCGVVLSKSSLRGVILDHAVMRGADLRECDLSHASVNESILRGADLRQAKLCHANLRGANLVGADLRWADLEGADLRGTDLRGADLRKVDISRARLEGAEKDWADFDDPASLEPSCRD